MINGRRAAVSQPQQQLYADDSPADSHRTSPSKSSSSLAIPPVEHSGGNSDGQGMAVPRLRYPPGGSSPTQGTSASRRPTAHRTASSGSTGGGTSSEINAKLLTRRQSYFVGGDVAPGMLGVGAPPMPALPAPGTLERRTTTQAKRGSTQPIHEESESDMLLRRTGLDVDMLASEDFVPEDFLRVNLKSSGGRETTVAQTEDLRSLRTRLEQAMKITEGDLQRSVFRNYADFVVISKEIATLESEMLELKSVIEEWRAVPESLEGGWGDDDLILGGAPNRRTQRNSLADLATLYRTQLSALWDGVEGSQKYLPFTPGRHLVAEAASFIELNSASYKPRQAVHLFLLNDALLVSVKKRRGPVEGAGAKTRLVAERCFNLSEIVVVDLKDGGDLSNAIKIKRSKETIIFRTDRPEEKKALLIAFKKVAEELQIKRRKDTLNEAEARKGDSAAVKGAARMDYDGTVPTAGFSPHAILGFGPEDATSKDLSWIGDYSDELAVTIALRQFEEAVALVEKGKIILPNLAFDPQALQLFRTNLDLRTSQLVTSLLQDLSDHAIRKSGVVRTTACLLRLGQGEKARETFLTGRGTLVRKRARQIKFEGDISMYISELAMVSFTLVKNTCEWYMAAFKDNRMASGFVRWASEQVEIYAETFRRQVYGADQDRKVIEESLEVTKSHGAMLRDVGLDFTFLLNGLLQPDVPPLATNNSGPPASDNRAGVGSALAHARKSVFIQGSKKN